ncbi:helix-turn-helix domain-containing protein [Peptoniphilus ovalis]|nr:helix-turn-helix domain-containing protein [Peptoniphilus ovalis]
MKGLNTWGFKAYPTENKNIIEYVGIDAPKNRMKSYLILPGIYVMFITLGQKYVAHDSDYNGRFGYRIAYCYEGNYYTHINDTKVLITREIFVGKSIPKSLESYSTNDRTTAFNIVIAPKELDKTLDYYKIIDKFIKISRSIKDIGIILNNKELLFVANQLIDNLKKEDLFLITLKTLELIYIITKENINEIRKKYYQENNTEDMIEIERFISNNLDLDINLDLICKKFKISKSYLNNNFMRKFQYTPIKYLNNIRMIKAENYLINTNMEITDIAEKIGFKNPSNFSRSFKKFTGISPSKYRKNNKD